MFSLDPLSRVRIGYKDGTRLLCKIQLLGKLSRWEVIFREERREIVILEES